ncbi:DoxX family protein [Kribbella sp. NPDC026611]|uniref:DoxX family protein n=1 Tax=Kribbella sp. NPDC026611 TaxID=3154911 RepID=UPI0033F04659
MNVVLWIVAGVLAAVLLVSTSKMFVPREKLASLGGAAAEWVLDFSPAALRAIGVLEILGAAGLILPAALDIVPILVPVTATCVALLFVGAVIMRLGRGEKATIVPDLVYLAMAVFVAWGRFGPESFVN